MKKILFFLLCLTFGLNAQSISLFGTAVTPQDTSILISDGAGNTTSYWYEWDDPGEFEGACGLWHAAYSYSDGISVTIFLSFRTRTGEDNTGNYRVTGYTTLDSLTTSDDTSVRYGAGDQVGLTVSLGAQITNWAPSTEIQFRWNWTTAAADTAEIHAVLRPVNN